MILIDWKDHFVVNEYRRRAKAIEHVEGSELKPPAFLAIAVVGEQSKVLKEHINIGAISDRTWRCRPVNVLQAPGLITRRLALPEDLSRLPIETNNKQLLIVMRRDEDTVVG